MVAAFGLLALSGCDALDDCLDAGGSWDSDLDQCTCTDQEREKYGDISSNEAVEMCTAEYEAIKSQKAAVE